MTTEFVLLLSFFALILFGVVFGDSGPRATFAGSAPRLAARLERNIATGTGWVFKGASPEWIVPPGAAPQNN